MLGMTGNKVENVKIIGTREMDMDENSKTIFNNEDRYIYINRILMMHSLIGKHSTLEKSRRFSSHPVLSGFTTTMEPKYV